MPKKLKYPKLEKGIRVQFTDRQGKTRAGRIKTRRGNTVTVITPLKTKSCVNVDNILGYWKPKVRASPENMTKLEV